jgi:GNAT superfamily N-acetyltransferase
MIKEISFDTIKLFWRVLWPDTDAKYVGRIYLPKCPYVSDEYIQRHKENPDLIPSVFLGYFIGDKIVGVLNGYPTSNIHYRTRGLWVNPSYRNRKIATKLIYYIEEIARENNYSVLWTLPRRSAIDFYKTLDFVQMTDFIVYNNNNCYAIKMIKRRD